MAIKFLKDTRCETFLEALSPRMNRVVAPVKTDGVVQFQPWKSGKDVELDVLLAKQSPKEYVFLQTETYLKFGYEHGADPGRRGRRSGHPARDGGGGRRSTRRRPR